MAGVVVAVVFVVVVLRFAFVVLQFVAALVLVER